MKVTMFLADIVRLSEGKLDLLGAGWTSTIANPHPTAIGIVIECPWAQIDTPHRRPPSRSHSAWASLKNAWARC